ncbi:hypothetical protein [Microvirga yunnanensis]|uniref:hypothetical protein n=1 Tax=Microvirga yunnanensis TaxID=2953740 RepID=UPI0021C9D718|nr:hypothetical protein [Microvirga sp. HBU65207]
MNVGDQARGNRGIPGLEVVEFAGDDVVAGIADIDVRAGKLPRSNGLDPPVLQTILRLEPDSKAVLLGFVHLGHRKPNDLLDPREAARKGAVEGMEHFMVPISSQDLGICVAVFTLRPDRR